MRLSELKVARLRKGIAVALGLLHLSEKPRLLLVDKLAPTAVHKTALLAILAKWWTMNAIVLGLQILKALRRRVLPSGR